MCRKVLAPIECNSAFDTESTTYMFENFVWCLGEKASEYTCQVNTWYCCPRITNGSYF